MSSGVLKGGSGGSLGARFRGTAFLFSLAFPFAPLRGRRGSSTRFSAFCLAPLQGTLQIIRIHLIEVKNWKC